MNFHFSFTPTIVRNLMAIEAARQEVRFTMLPPQTAERLRQAARLRSTHYSTRIEGNRLRKLRRYRLSAVYRQFIGRVSTKNPLAGEHAPDALQWTVVSL